MTEGKRGRPSLYSTELAGRIVELIAEGHSERQIAKMDGMPSVRTILSWKDQHPDFLRQSARAHEAVGFANFLAKPTKVQSARSRGDRGVLFQHTLSFTSDPHARRQRSSMTIGAEKRRQMLAGTVTDR